ncbi:meckelin isoform 2-T2 [Cochliomyia hominivorax]
MVFHCFNIITILTVLINFNYLVFCSKVDYINEKNFNRTLFLYDDIKNCAKTDFYDINYFQCKTCKKIDENLQTTQDQFSCGCKTPSSSHPTSLIIYDAIKTHMTCHNMCNVNLKQIQHKLTNVTTSLIDNYCSDNETQLPRLNCKYKYINRTIINNPISSSASPAQLLGDFSRRLEITLINWQYDGLCDDCNIEYNFHYQDYCIANGLLRSYLSYNSFWQSTTSTQHFGDLKFVAFFCMALGNQTACNQLANLCVLSHYANDKNSPCNKFLLSQASDVMYRYGGVEDEFLMQKQLKPFLYYRKGKETLEELGVPIKGLKYSIDEENINQNHLKFFVTSYALDGTLLRWGSLRLNDLNLCPLAKNSWSFINFLKFAHKYDAIECSLTLEDLIEMAKLYDNNRFISLFLNYSRYDVKEGQFLQTIPILIEDLHVENKRSRKEDWQLVKRFQLIQFQPRHGSLGSKAAPIYEDSHKLLLFRSLRYADKIQLHYDIHDNNHISIPILRLHYRHIEFTSNSSLNTRYNFKMIITFTRIGESAKGELLNEIALPISLFLALVIALFKANNKRKRRSSFCASMSSSSATHLTGSLQNNNNNNNNNNDDFCHFTFFTEFLLHLISYMAIAFLICFLLHVFMNSLVFLSQDNIELTLPIVKDQRSLELIIYAALILKLINIDAISHGDTTLKIFYISLIYIVIYISQYVVLGQILTRFTGNPIQKYIEHCSLANISVFTLVEPSFGYYIHGRSPHGFADSDMATMIMQLQRETHSICGRRGLLSDTDQCYVIMPPKNLSNYFDKLLLPYQSSLSSGTVVGGVGSSGGGGGGVSSTNIHFQKEINTIEGTLEKTSIAYCSVNRFFCAFIDHGIKDMDYIIKEKTIIERLLDCEFDNYLTDNKGTFYIDTCFSFTQMFLYGNELQLFVLEFLLLLAVYLISSNLLAAVISVCIFNKIFQSFYRYAVKENISNKTLIDKRFLM